MYTFDQGEVIEVGAHAQRPAALPDIAPFDALLVLAFVACKRALQLLCCIDEMWHTLHRPSSSHGA